MAESQSIYLDCAASTRMDEIVAKDLKDYIDSQTFGNKYGNPSSMHPHGRIEKTYIENARSFIKKQFGASDVIFTSGATEATNIALRGIVSRNRKFGKHVIIGPTEHESVHATAGDLALDAGVDFESGKLTATGELDLEYYKKIIKKDTILIVQMMVSNLFGTLYDLQGVYNIMKEQAHPQCVLHIDVVQAVGKVPIFCMPNCTYSVSAHKINGPKGVGCLLFGKFTQQETGEPRKTDQIIRPILTGGGQENHLRGGTENTMAIIGLESALKIALDPANMKKKQEHFEKLYETAVSVEKNFEIIKETKSVKNILSIKVANAPAEVYFNTLMEKGVFCSIGSACQSNKKKKSSAFFARGFTDDETKHVLRFSFDKYTTSEDVRKGLEVLNEISTQFASGFAEVKSAMNITCSSSSSCSMHIDEEPIVKTVEPKIEKVDVENNMKKRKPEDASKTPMEAAETAKLEPSKKKSKIEKADKITTMTKHSKGLEVDDDDDGEGIPEDEEGTSNPCQLINKKEEKEEDDEEEEEKEIAKEEEKKKPEKPQENKPHPERKYKGKDIKELTPEELEKRQKGREKRERKREKKRKNKMVVLFEKDCEEFPEKYQGIICRYGEIALKGKNRTWFENVLIENIRVASVGIIPGGVTIMNNSGRILIVLKKEEDFPHFDELLERLRWIPGLFNVSPSYRIKNNLEAMKKFVAFLGKKEQDRRAALLKDGDSLVIPFKINAHRQTKECFPINSPKICEELGGDILDLNKPEIAADGTEKQKKVTFKVNLSNPEYEISLDVREFGVFVFNTKFSCMGGMPVGTSRSVLCLLSGGFDSPVSSYLMTKRGCAVNFISFWSNPFIGIKLVDKIKQLVGKLSKFNSHSPTNLYLIPFANIQIAIRDNCAERYRTVLYRRGMNYVANKIAKRYKMKALITGEALAQVASQTLPNMTCIEDSAAYPVLRPCIAMDKMEILDIAKHIGTHDISIIETPDCCTLFQPRKPVIQAKLSEVKEEEARIPDYEKLIDEAYKGVEIFQIKAGKEEMVKLQ